MNALMQKELEMKLITILLFVTIAAFARTPESQKPVTDAEKVADAARAGPEFVTKDATLLDWPATPGGEYRVLRKGSSQWTCLPGLPGSPHDEPGCFDPVFLQFIKDSIAGRTPNGRVSEFHICMVASGCLTSRMRWEATVNSTLGHTS